jgi:hypothetical protein
VFSLLNRGVGGRHRRRVIRHHLESRFDTRLEVLQVGQDAVQLDAFLRGQLRQREAAITLRNDFDLCACRHTGSVEDDLTGADRRTSGGGSAIACSALIFASGDAPPCLWQRVKPIFTGRLHGVPLCVAAPQSAAWPEVFDMMLSCLGTFDNHYTTHVNGETSEISEQFPEKQAF